LRKLYPWQHIGEEVYKRERARLEVLRADLTAVTRPVSTLQLDGISVTWRVGDATIRRELLAASFQSLIVRDGVVVEYISRQNCEAEVICSWTLFVGST
jgi:hypothetical protein